MVGDDFEKRCLDDIIVLAQAAIVFFQERA